MDRLAAENAELEHSRYQHGLSEGYTHEQALRSVVMSRYSDLQGAAISAQGKSFSSVGCDQAVLLQHQTIQNPRTLPSPETTAFVVDFPADAPCRVALESLKPASRGTFFHILLTTHILADEVGRAASERSQ